MTINMKDHSSTTATTANPSNNTTGFENMLYEYVKKQFDSDSIKYMKVDDIPLSDTDEEGRVRNMRIEKFFIDLKFKEDSIDTDKSKDVESPEDRDGQNENIGFVQHTLNTLLKITPVAENSENLTDFEQKIALRKERNWLVKGNAGQGKSTLLQFLTKLLYANYLVNTNKEQSFVDSASEFLTESRNLKIENFHNKYLPIRVVLSDYDDFVTRSDESNKNLLSYIASQILNGKKMSEKSFNAFKEDCWNYLIYRNFILLFDGFDEITQNKDYIKSQIDHFADVSVMSKSNILTITSTRRESSEAFSDKEYDIFNLLELDKESVFEYVDRYSKKFNTETKKTFLDDIREKYISDSDVHGLMKTPLEVTLICLVRETVSKIPSSRNGLYDNYIDMYFTRAAGKSNGEFKFLNDDEKRNIIKGILYRIGYECVINSRKEITAEDIVKYICEENRFDNDQIISSWAEDSTKAIRKTITKGLGLLVPIPNSPNRFSIINHASISEYLASKYIQSLCDSNNDETYIIKLAYNLRFNEVLKFALEYYSINKPKIAYKILSSLAHNIEDFSEFHPVINSINLKAYHAMKILSYNIFSDLPACQSVLISQATKIFAMDVTESDDSPMELIIDYISNQANSSQLIDNIFIQMNDIHKKGYNFWEAYKTLFAHDLIKDEALLYPVIDNYIGKCLAQYVDTSDENIKDNELFNWLRYPLRNNRKSFLETLLTIKNKAGTLCLPNGFKISSLEQLYTMELIRAQLKSFPKNTELYRISQRALNVDRTLLITSESKQLYTQNISTPNKDEQAAYKLTISVVDKEENKTKIETLIDLCQKYNLPAFAEVFKTLANFNEDTFIGFAHKLYAGEYTDELRAVLGEFNYPKFGSDLYCHPIFIAIDEVLNDTTTFNESEYRDNFSIYSEGKELKSLSEAIKLSYTSPVQIFMSFSKEAEFMDFMTSVFDAFLVEYVNFEDGPQRDLYIHNLLFIFQMAEEHLYREKYNKNCDSVLSLYREKLAPYKDIIIELLNWFVKSDSSLTNTRFVCAVLNYILFTTDFAECFSLLEKFDFGKYNKNYDKAIRNLNYKRVSASASAHNIKSSDFYLKIIDNLSNLVLAHNRIDALHYLELLFLQIDGKSRELVERHSTIKQLLEKCESKGAISKVLKIISNIIKWNEKVNGINCQIIAEEIKDCATNSPIICSWMTYDMFFRFLRENYREPSAKSDYCLLISSILSCVPVDSEHLGVRQRMQKHLLSELNSLQLVFRP